MKKRIFSALCALLLAVSCAAPAFAGLLEDTETFEIPEMNLTVELPAGMYAFTRDSLSPLSPDPDLAGAGITDAQTQLSEMEDYGGYLLAKTEDGLLTINISKKESSSTQSVFDFTLLSDEEFQSFIDTMSSTDGAGEELLDYSVTRYDDQPERPFVAVHLKVDTSKGANAMEDGGVMEELSYVTIVNGFSISIDGVTDGEMTQEQKDLLRRIADSAHITEVLERPTLSTGEIVSLLSPLLLILVIVLVVVFVKLRNRRLMRQRRELADRLAAYRREQKRREAEAEEAGEPLREPEPLVRNSTPYTEEAAHAFVRCHLSHRQIGVLVFYVIMAVLLASAAIFLQLEWYMRLVFGGVAVFAVVWMCLMPGKLFNNVAATFRKARVKQNEYLFHADDFRVTGVQASSVYPYFQIIGAYETKTYFYLYFTAEQAYFVAKDGFTQGTAEELRALLREKLGKRFHG